MDSNNDEKEVPTEAPTAAPTVVGETTPPNEKPPSATPVDQTKRADFWLVLVSLLMATFVSALDNLAVSTALPTIVNKLHGKEFVWVGSAYSLASTAFLPLSGGLAQIYGRKPVTMGVLALFLVGSALCGAAKSMNMLIAGRTVQGVGSGGILALTEIIIADLVPLSKRGAYMGFFGAVWAVASAAGPPIGGALSQANWRWLFYLNVPLTAIAMGLVFMFLHVQSPKEDFKTKMKRMDWIGNILVVASATATIIALTWGGVRYPWDSAKVLAPLILGLVGLLAFFIYEGLVPYEPVVPWALIRNRTSLSGYLIVFWHAVIVGAIGFYIPVYFQAVKLQGPLKSGVSFLAVACTIAPGAIIAGASTTIFGIYRPQNYIGWFLILIGLGLLTLLKVDTKVANWVGYQIPIGFGLGVLFTAPTFPILAPLPLTESAHALALLAFMRQFAFTWGTTIGSTILQNQLSKKLPQDFLSRFSSGNLEIAYAVIPSLPYLPADLKLQVQTAFASSLQLIWYVMLGIAGAGLVTCFMMQEIDMPDVTDEAWAMKDQKEARARGAKVASDEKEKQVA